MSVWLSTKNEIDNHMPFITPMVLSSHGDDAQVVKNETEGRRTKSFCEYSRPTHVHKSALRNALSRVTSAWVRKTLREFGVPYGNRTRVAAVKGRCPRPLDERDADGGKLHASASALR